MTRILIILLMTLTLQVNAEYKFKEIWAYVMKGEEKHLTGKEPITDIGYFSAVVNDIGRLKEGPDIQKIPPPIRTGRRIHLIISAPGNIPLMYWCLSKDKETRELLIQDILKAAEPYDGLQIDFETIRAEDGPAYIGFLKEIKSRLPKGKIFSVAVPARTKELKDAFDYKQIAEVSDRVIVMAYDEHWRTGEAGPIASLKWCEKVCAFSMKTIPNNKLVMGLPLYGRIWQKEVVARPLKYFETLEVWKQQQSLLARDPDGTPNFTFEQPVHATVYFEDMQSLDNKLSHYAGVGISSVAFWRHSQGPAALWSSLQANPKN